MIGGLLFATVATLFFVPTVFGLLHTFAGTKKIGDPQPQHRSVEH